MHSPSTAYETIELLWNNYLNLSEEVDVESIPIEKLDLTASIRPYRIAAWLARLGYFIAAWCLWEFYSKSVCDSLENQEKRSKGESHCDWVAKTLGANGIAFSDHSWFNSAGCLRNLIAHYGCRAVDPRAKKLVERSSEAFPDIHVLEDGYIEVSHSQVADLQLKLEDFIKMTG